MNIVEASYNHVIKGYPMPANSYFLDQHLINEDAEELQAQAEERQEAIDARREYAAEEALLDSVATKIKSDTTSDVYALVVESMLEGGKFYPFSLENFDTAMRKLPDGDMANLCAFVRSSVKLKTNQVIDTWIAGCIKDTVTEYWKERATNHFNDPKNWG